MLNGLPVIVYFLRKMECLLGGPQRYSMCQAAWPDGYQPGGAWVPDITLNEPTLTELSELLLIGR